MEYRTDKYRQLFQQEFSKMVAVISRQFGLQHIEIAEDIVGDTFLTAIEEWESGGLPPNPEAWLYLVAKRKTLYYNKRSKIFNRKIIPELKHEQEKYSLMEFDFSAGNIRDSQMRMLFAICNPLIGSEAQIGLALRILCGFSIDEIAEAFYSSKTTINKRLFRAKEKLRTENLKMELPDKSELDSRLDNVLHIIYLLFSEGYYSRTQNSILRKEFCLDAMRLAILLTEYEITNSPKANALLALMCFHASRFDARQTAKDDFILYEEQDKNLWDEELIRKGNYYLNQSARGEEISSYHLEAKIAHWHSVKEDSQEKWESILHLYNLLLIVNYSPGAALNGTYALYRAHGREAALAEAGKLKLDSNHFYFLLLAELYGNQNPEMAMKSFEQALKLARTDTEKQVIQAKMDRLR
jgi:RNA polymerase sigma-70 factor (ECF subfamily)